MEGHRWVVCGTSGNDTGPPRPVRTPLTLESPHAVGQVLWGPCRTGVSRTVIPVGEGTTWTDPRGGDTGSTHCSNLPFDPGPSSPVREPRPDSLRVPVSGGPGVIGVGGHWVSHCEASLVRRTSPGKEVPAYVHWVRRCDLRSGPDTFFRVVRTWWGWGPSSPEKTSVYPHRCVNGETGPLTSRIVRFGPVPPRPWSPSRVHPDRICRRPPPEPTIPSESCLPLPCK